MNQSPSIDDLIEGVIISLGDDLLPHLNTAKAQATAVMAQAVLQAVRQLIEVQDTNLVLDHNEMTEALRASAAALGDTPGPTADRVRERAATLGQTPDLPAPPDRDAMNASHSALGEAMEANLRDLDELLREGAANGEAALTALRAGMVQRYLRDVAASTVGEGMVGRG